MLVPELRDRGDPRARRVRRCRRHAHARHAGRRGHRAHLPVLADRLARLAAGRGEQRRRRDRALLSRCATSSPTILDPPRPVALAAPVRGELRLRGRAVPLPGRRPRGAARRRPHRAARRDDGAGRRDRVGQDHAHRARRRGSTTSPAAACCSTASTSATLRAGRAAPRGRHRVRGPGADLGQRAGERRARACPDARRRATIWAALRVAQRRRVRGARCRGGSTPGSASRGCRCPAGSGSGSRWPARCWAGRRCSCSTTRSPRWTCTPRPRSRRRCAGCWAGSPRSWWRTGRRPCSSPTGWRCCATGGSPRSAPTASCWRPIPPTGRCWPARARDRGGAGVTADRRPSRPGRRTDGWRGAATRRTSRRRRTGRAGCACSARARRLLGDLVRPHRRAVAAGAGCCWSPRTR